jgi:hypothetical protein
VIMSVNSDNFITNMNTETITVLPPPHLMRTIHFGNFLFYSFALVILTLIIFSALKLLHIPAGQMIDWAIGLISFWWLLVVVTIPWNVCFQAKETLVEFAASRERGISTNAKQVEYVRRVARGALIVAIVSHIVSAIVLFALAFKGISAVGYIGSVAAVLLTGLRPGLRAYQYLWARLAAIRGQIIHPREDIVELRSRFTMLENKVSHLTEELDENKQNSWANNKATAIRELRDKLFNLKTALESLKEENEKDHQRLVRETQSAVAQLTADSQFLDHVREIIRFFKTA